MVLHTQRQWAKARCLFSFFSVQSSRPLIRFRDGRGPELVEQLQRISGYMRRRLHERNVPIMDAQTPIIPIYTYDPIVTLQAQKELYERGVYVNATLPPACAPGECLLRCTLMATHTGWAARRG